MAGLLNVVRSKITDMAHPAKIYFSYWCQSDDNPPADVLPHSPYYFFLIGFPLWKAEQPLQDTRHAATRKKKYKKLKLTGNLFRKNR